MQEIPNNVPYEYRPISSWGYIGYNLLYSIPLVGFILMIVHAFDDSYMCRRNYARSFFCWMLIGLIITVLMFILFMVFGFGFAALSNY